MVDWVLLLSYVPFATGFTPFELLFGRNTRGLLDVDKEVCEAQASLFRTVIDYIQNMQQRIDIALPIIREHLEAVQK